jgi:hypothetical protein
MPPNLKATAMIPKLEAKLFKIFDRDIPRYDLGV